MTVSRTNRPPFGIGDVDVPVRVHHRLRPLCRPHARRSDAQRCKRPASSMRSGSLPLRPRSVSTPVVPPSTTHHESGPVRSMSVSSVVASMFLRTYATNSPKPGASSAVVSHSPSPPRSSDRGTFHPRGRVEDVIVREFKQSGGSAAERLWDRRRFDPTGAFGVFRLVVAGDAGRLSPPPTPVVHTASSERVAWSRRSPPRRDASAVWIGVAPGVGRRSRERIRLVSRAAFFTTSNASNSHSSVSCTQWA